MTRRAPEGAVRQGRNPESALPPVPSHDGIPSRADSVLDTLGLYCPVPIIRTAERVRGLESGDVLEVVSDDRVILVDMPAWCRAMGHDYLGARQDEGRIRLYVRKGRAGERRR